MRRLFVSVSLFTVSMAVIGAVCAVTADDKGKADDPARGEQRAPAAQGPATSRGPVGRSEKPTEDDVAIRKLEDEIVSAYRQHNAQTFAAVFTADGEYVDTKEGYFHGRDEIEKEFGAFFKANPDTTIQLSLEQGRQIAPGLIKVQGVTRFQRTPNDSPVTGRCSLVCIKNDQQWAVASLREMDGSGETLTHHDHLRQLDWMIGDWIYEGPRSEVHFNCRWDRSGNYLLREFTVHAAGRKAITGTQRIGFDSLTSRLKIWIFDSEGGYSEGYFRRSETGWILHTTGVTADGRLASGTEIFAADQHRIAWDSVDRIIDGERLPDSGKITVVRKPPAPASAAAVHPQK